MVILALGKSRSRRVWNWAVRGLSHLDDLMFHQNLCTRHDAWAGALLWWSCQSPVVHSCSLLNHLNSFCRGIFKLNAKFEADSLLYLLRCFECNGHTVHMFTLWCLPPPLTSTVKLSLFIHMHSSSLSLAARLHRCCANSFRYITNDCTFSGQTSYYEMITTICIYNCLSS